VAVGLLSAPVGPCFRRSSAKRGFSPGRLRNNWKSMGSTCLPLSSTPGSPEPCCRLLALPFTRDGSSVIRPPSAKTTVPATNFLDLLHRLIRSGKRRFACPGPALSRQGCVFGSLDSHGEDSSASSEGDDNWQIFEGALWPNVLAEGLIQPSDERGSISRRKGRCSLQRVSPAV
jgi:hypothetical protein